MSDKNTGTQFRFTKEDIRAAATARIKFVDEYRKKFREDQIERKMTERRWSWRKLRYIEPMTRQEAEAAVDAPWTNYIDYDWHWQNQLSHSYAKKMIRLCDASEDDFVMLGFEDADTVETWQRQHVKNP